MQKSETITKLATALKGFQGEVGNVPKDAVNPFFKSKYASLENVVETVKPILAKHGLSYVQIPDDQYLTTMLMHESGEYIAATAFMGAKDNTPQGIGSAITYMRRYALSAVLGIATEDDDDGNAASAKPAAKAVPTKAWQKPTAIELKKKIKDLCNATGVVELKSKEDYEHYVEAQTGLKLEVENYEEIIERLEALKK